MKGGADRATAIAELLRSADGQYAFVVATRDHHKQYKALAMELFP
ncbi:hypothetical protein AB0J35_58735 [Nonomuraea angiospora]